jgi:CubicO group peptidase (beta-lactamase class C family)
MDMRALSLALVAVLLSWPVLADPFPTSVPETVGLSSERLQHLSTTLQNEVDRHRIPGAVIAVARKSQLAYYEALGFRDPEAKVPMPRDAIFSIASMTKPMVSVAIMMLHDEGNLVLSDPVGKYLPALAKMQVATINTDSAGRISDASHAGCRKSSYPCRQRPVDGAADRPNKPVTPIANCPPSTGVANV